MLLHDLGTDRRRPVLVEVMRHGLHCGIGQLGAIGSCVLSAVDLTRLHLRKPLKRQKPSWPPPSARQPASSRRQHCLSTAPRPPWSHPTASSPFFPFRSLD